MILLALYCLRLLQVVLVVNFWVKGTSWTYVDEGRGVHTREGLVATFPLTGTRDFISI